MKDGFQEKIVNIETALPKDLVKYPAYECTVSLQKTASPNVDAFYTDFPSAIVRYNFRADLSEHESTQRTYALND